MTLGQTLQFSVSVPLLGPTTPAAAAEHALAARMAATIVTELGAAGGLQQAGGLPLGGGGLLPLVATPASGGGGCSPTAPMRRERSPAGGEGLQPKAPGPECPLLVAAGELQLQANTGKELRLDGESNGVKEMRTPVCRAPALTEFR